MQLRVCSVEVEQVGADQLAQLWVLHAGGGAADCKHALDAVVAQARNTPCPTIPVDPKRITFIDVDAVYPSLRS